MNFNIQEKYLRLIFFSIIALGLALRFYFYLGHVFSDDAYFSYLSYTLYAGDFGRDYLGYPVSLLRFNLHLLTALAFSVFGPNELAASVFPMLFSVANLFLVYYLAKLISKSSTVALTALFLMALFPTDVIFAGLDFADAFSAFFINLGIYFLLLAREKESMLHAVFAGLSFALSVQFKINVFYIAVLLSCLLVYDFLKKKKANPYLLLSLSFIALDLVIEAFIYYKLNGNFLYRFKLTEQNYLFGRNDFFVEGSAFGYAGEGQYWPALFKMLFIYNPKAVFLRRFSMFLPVLALLQSFLCIKKKEHRLPAFWFLGLAFLYLFFTSSFGAYRPLVQRFTWYIYPLFMPAVLLSALFLTRLKKRMLFLMLLLYFAGSLYMCVQYQRFFNKDNNEAFKSYLKENETALIYSDHFTKYSIDLLDGYKQPLRTRRILGKDFDARKIKSGALVVFHQKHIKELQGQGFTFPEFFLMPDSAYLKVASFGDFFIYKKDSDGTLVK